MRTIQQDSQDAMQIASEPTTVKAAKVTMLASRLITQNPFGFFAQNCEDLITDWVLLLRQTAIPDNTPVSNSHFTLAFRAVDDIICHRKGTAMLRRLAYIRLMQLFSSLTSLIKADRNSGKTVRAPHQRDSTIALDVYISAQNDQHISGVNLRQKLRERKRLGKRWSELAITSPLFILVYSTHAESVM